MSLQGITRLAKRIYNFFGKWVLLFFLASLFLIKTTPFYYLSFTSKLFSSHTLAKAIVFGIFIIIVFSQFKKIDKLIKENTFVFKIVGVYFLAQSLSIFAVVDVLSFWRSYHNLIIAILIFLLSYFFTSSKGSLKQINKFVLISGAVLVIYELIFFLFPEVALPLLEGVVQKEVLDAYYTNLSRARYSLDINTELFLPLFLLWAVFPLKKDRPLFRVGLILLSAALVYISLLSNFRSRVLMSTVGLFGLSLVYLIEQIRKKQVFSFKKVVGASLIILFAAYMAVFTSNRLFSFNVFDRFLLQDKREDVETINFRFGAADKSIEMYKSSPLFGIGLGNYAVYSEKPNFALQRFYYLDRYREEYSKRVTLSPHNVLLQVASETGSLGVVSFGFLIIYFAVRDMKYLLKEKLNLVKGYVLSFWVMVVFMLFNPASTIFMIGWFWFFRGVIEASYFYSLDPNSL